MKFLVKNLPVSIALFFLFIYLSPYLFFSHTAHFLIHDNLDSEIGWYKMIAESGLTFSSNKASFLNLFNGIPRGCMPSELDFYTLLNLILSPLPAYCLLVILQHVAAFFGMRLLLKDYLFKNEYPYHTNLIALAFAILPFWPLGEFCIAGQPFVIWALLNLFYSRKTTWNYIILILFPFCSSHFAFSNLFFLPGLLLSIIIFSWVLKKWSMPVFLGWLTMFFLGAVSEYRLFLLHFIDGITPQRVDYYSDQLLNWKGYLKDVLLFSVNGQYHFSGCQAPIIITTFLLSLIILRSKRDYFFMFIPLALILLFSSLDTFHFWENSAAILKNTGPFSTIQLRFTSLIPLIWYLVFAVSIYFLIKQNKKFSFLWLLPITAQIFFLFFDIIPTDFQGSRFSENAFYYTFVNPEDNVHNSFDAYFNPNLFTEVRKKINYNGETILCLGFASELAQYNRFNTAAGYLDYYPEDRKQNLVNIFSNNLNEIPDLNERRKITGSRKFQYYYSHNLANAIYLNLDTVALKKMNIHYILSFDKIVNPDPMRLVQLDYIYSENPMYFNHLYAYRVNLQFSYEKRGIQLAKR